MNNNYIKNNGSYWVSLTDMMSGLMLIFMFLFIAFLATIPKDNASSAIILSSSSVQRLVIPNLLFFLHFRLLYQKGLPLSFPFYYLHILRQSHCSYNRQTNAFSLIRLLPYQLHDEPSQQEAPTSEALDTSVSNIVPA